MPRSAVLVVVHMRRVHPGMLLLKMLCTCCMGWASKRYDVTLTYRLSSEGN